MYVDLPHQYKGTHMSRFVEMLHVFKSGFSLRLSTFSTILENMKKSLDAESSHIEISFPYFVEKKAPVSMSLGLMDYTCTISSSSNSDGVVDLVLNLEIPITSVCPCSREISDNGAHNQRGIVSLSVRGRKFVWIEDMIDMVEDAASCEVYSVLKRVDEKYVTEKGYNNPKFVEDIVRDVAKKLREDDNIIWFSVSAENFESIHNHSAYAYIESK
ncbi:MAG: GTP cyclohydrolase I FolE2 [Desulfobacteraceae bacterium 4572_19]|nr:MAG: GTP cyclohydrolase I FolE2 [Desulfobacteraceae bacterium 4572_19]